MTLPRVVAREVEIGDRRYRFWRRPDGDVQIETWGRRYDRGGEWHHSAVIPGAVFDSAVALELEPPDDDAVPIAPVENDDTGMHCAVCDHYHHFDAGGYLWCHDGDRNCRCAQWLTKPALAAQRSIADHEAAGFKVITPTLPAPAQLADVVNSPDGRCQSRSNTGARCTRPAGHAERLHLAGNVEWIER